MSHPPKELISKQLSRKADAAPTTFFTIRQIAERHPSFSERTLRHWIHLSRSRSCCIKGKRVIIPGNGFDRVFYRRGRRIYIDERALVEWIRSGGAGGL